MDKRQRKEPWMTIDGFSVKKIPSSNGKILGFKVWPVRHPEQAELVPYALTYTGAVEEYKKRHHLFVVPKTSKEAVMVLGGVLRDLPLGA